MKIKIQDEIEKLRIIESQQRLTKYIKYIKITGLKKKAILQKEVTENYSLIGVSLVQFIINLMEHNRRNLRNNNKCQQINNLFNIKTNSNHLSTHLPPQILAQIGKLQKISCCHINNLPELHPQFSIEEELEKCRAAQETLSSFTVCEQKNEFDSRVGLIETAQKQRVISGNSLFCKEQYESRQQVCLIEKEQNPGEIWKDTELVDKLNDFFMFGGNDRLALNHQLFQK